MDGRCSLANNSDNLTGTRHLRRTAWLGLLAVACLQLTVAGHQFSHAAESIEKSCRVCVQLDRLDDVDIDFSPATIESAGYVSETFVHRVGDGAQIFARSYRSRAPPLL